MAGLRLEPERHAASLTNHRAPTTGEAPGDLARLALASDRRAALGLFLRHLARGERVAQRLAIRRADLVESVVATQVVLEALGEAMLERLDAGIARRGAGFARLRRTVLRQEAAHHAFGVRFVDRALDAAMIAPSAAARLVSSYLELVHAMVASGGAALGRFGIEPAAIGAEVRARLPRWATP